MQTKQVYYEQPYLKDLEATVVSVEDAGSLINIILDQTIFYPEGGGQPSDRGVIGDAKVQFVRISDGEIIQQVQGGSLEEGQTVQTQLDWDWRYKYMQIHTAGHLLHDVLMTLYPDLVPIRGSHGKKAFLEYNGEINPDEQEAIEKKVNESRNQDLEVVTKEATLEQLKEECQFVPPNLPSNKSLRMIRIGEYLGMPDGGMHVKSTKEIGKIYIPHIGIEDGVTKVRYGVVQQEY